MLTLPSKKPFYCTYIDDKGAVKVLTGNIEYDINVSSNVSDTWSSIIDKYHNITIIRGYSNVEISTANELKTPLINIKTDNNLIYHTPMMPYLGSIKECIENSINHEMCNMMSVVNNTYSSSYVNINNISSYFVLTYVNKDGIKSKIGKLSFEYAKDRNDNCTTCVNAHNKLEDILNDINGKILFDKENINEDFYINSSESIEVNTKEFDVTSLINNIYMDLYGICSDAKVTKIIFTEEI